MFYTCVGMARRGEGGEKEGEGRMVIFGVNMCICECMHMCIATPLWNVTEGTNARPIDPPDEHVP